VAQKKAETQQKLTAVFATEVVGYSRLTGDDPDATVKTLAPCRPLFSSYIEKSQGRIVSAPGDSIFAENESVMDAVHCAVANQRQLACGFPAVPSGRCPP
jgi:class 3 adenylate cyclase